MFRLQNASVTKTIESKYVKPLSIDYTLNDFNKKWDLIEIHNSVSTLIYNKTRKVFIFVRQFRPAVYYNSIPEEDRRGCIDTTKYPVDLGMTIELCAGIIDKDKPVEEIAREEVMEECGYNVPLSNLTKVKSYRGSIGISGEHNTLFYAEVTDEMKESQGGGLASEGEFIECVEMSVPEAKQLFEQETIKTPPGFLLAICWWFSNIAPRLS